MTLQSCSPCPRSSHVWHVRTDTNPARGHFRRLASQFWGGDQVTRQEQYPHLRGGRVTQVYSCSTIPYFVQSSGNVFVVFKGGSLCQGRQWRRKPPTFVRVLFFFSLLPPCVQVQGVLSGWPISRRLGHLLFGHGPPGQFKPWSLRARDMICFQCPVNRIGMWVHYNREVRYEPYLNSRQQRLQRPSTYAIHPLISESRPW